MKGPPVVLVSNHKLYTNGRTTLLAVIGTVEYGTTVAGVSYARLTSTEPWRATSERKGKQAGRQIGWDSGFRGTAGERDGEPETSSA